jgi:8-hydroxy-5-deazaflavin:NADPH oxidoreductase
MKVAVLGRGNIGGGLGDLWEQAGHQVTRFGRGGGDVSDAEAVLIAIPGGAIAQLFTTTSGLEGKTVIDATNLIGTEPPTGFASNTEFIKSRTGGPTAKAFNTNFASLFGRLANASPRPSNIWCGDDEARAAAEELITDAGYEPVYAGGVGNAAMLEAFLALEFAIAQGGMSQFFYRIAEPDQF